MGDTEISERRLQAILDARFGGRLRKGKHQENSKACALELLSVAQGIPWTDNPELVRSFDLRPLNDIAVSDEVRTRSLLPVLAAYAGSLDWPEARQQEVANRLVILTVQRLIAELPDLPEAVRRQCRDVKTLKDAGAAAMAMGWAARAAGWAAVAAREAARKAAEAAARAAGKSARKAAERAEGEADRASVFQQACALWMEAAA